MNTEEESSVSDFEENQESLSGEFLLSQESEPELINKELELIDRSDTEISHWWKTLTLTSYFVTVVGGLACSIAIGNLIAAFRNQCILYSKLSLVNMDEFDGNVLKEENILEDKWGDIYDCEFCEFASVFSVVFAGMLFAMFMQCGRGGITSKGRRRSWEFVPLALLITAIFFIISTVIFAKTIGGLAFFCSYIARDANSPTNITSCRQVLGYHFYWDDFRTDLYLQYILAHVGATLTFVGWFASLVILIFRCLLGIDFVIHRKRSYTFTEKPDASKNKTKVRFLVGSEGSSYILDKNKEYMQLLTSSSSESESDETSFNAVDTIVETKKLM